MTKIGKLFLIAAPSGTGKTTITTKVIKLLASKISISRIVTYTTRAKRAGEIDAEDYFFISKTDFLKKITQEFFLEVTNYNNQCYGSPRYFVEEMKAGKSFIMITDRVGVTSIKELVPEAVTIWLSPPSLAELEKRLTLRGTENIEEIKKRLVIAQQEMIAERTNPIFQVHITNNVFQDTVTKVAQFIVSKLL